MKTQVTSELRKFGAGQPIHVRAQQAWMVLVHCAAVGKTITYGELAERMGYERTAARATIKPLAVIAYFCQKHELPQLNTLVVNADTGEPGPSVIRGRDHTGAAQQKVMAFDWFAVRIPTAGTFRAVWEEFS